MLAKEFQRVQHPFWGRAVLVAWDCHQARGRGGVGRVLIKVEAGHKMKDWGEKMSKNVVWKIYSTVQVQPSAALHCYAVEV